MKKVFFVVNSVSYFISHRLPIAYELLEQGYEVHVVAPDESSDIVTVCGIRYHRIAMSRSGINPFSDFLVIWLFIKLFWSLKPDVVHLITIKPYLYGGFAARLTRVPSVVSAVAGLGILFSKDTWRERLLRNILYPFYRIAFNHKNQVVIFQNSHDRDLLVKWDVLNLTKSVLIRGAGVNLELYPYCDEPSGIPVISFAARLLRDKGVEQLVAAANILKNRHIEADFWLIGEPDSGNANSVTEVQLDEWQEMGLIKCLGYRSDIAELFSKSNIVSLPSYYGEGLPKVLIEAAACGRSVVTTDHPGCRDAITPNETGVLVSIKDEVALADAIQYLIKNPDVRKSMGAKGRALAEKEFTIEKVVGEHILIYEDLLNKAR